MSPTAGTPLRVLLVVSSSRLAGTERHVVELAAGLRAAGVEAEVVCEAGGGGLDDVLVDRDVPVHPLRLTGGSVAGSVMRLARLSRRFDLLHAHLTHATAASVAAGALARRPVVETFHFLELAHEGRGTCRRIAGRARRRVLDAGVTATLGPSRAVLARVGPKAILVPHGVRPSSTAPRGPDAAGRFVTVGRLSPDFRSRANELALQGFAAALPGLPPGAELTVVGDGTGRGRLEVLARDLGIATHVRFTGRVSDVTAELGRAGAYLAPATEAFGMAALEAMASGLPVAGVARGGLLDLVDHERTGLLVEPEPEAVAAALVRLAKDPEATRAMGESARRRAAEEFSVERMVRLTIEAYALGYACPSLSESSEPAGCR